MKKGVKFIRSYRAVSDFFSLLLLYAILCWGSPFVVGPFLVSIFVSFSWEKLSVFDSSYISAYIFKKFFLKINKLS
jgi:hypothetical protein